MNNEWKDWCRLCAKPSTSGLHNIFENSGFERIKKYLSISVNNEDDLPQTVCQACSQRIMSFNSFAEHCVRVQEMFCALSKQSDNVFDRLDFIRSKYLQDDSKVLIERNKDSLLPSNETESFLLASSGIPAIRTILKLKTTRKTIPRTKVPTKKITLKHLSTKIKLEDPERRSSRLQELAQTHIDFGIEDALEVKIESENAESKEELPKKRGRPPKRIVGVVKRKIKTPKAVKLNKALLIDNDFEETGMEKPLNDKVSQPSIFQWKCHVCGEISRNWNSLSIHTRRSHDVAAQVLCLCAKVLTSRASIIKHRLKHTDGYKYKCEKCSKSFHRRGCYELHVLSHVPKEEQPFVCCKCARRFHCESLLRQHEKVHLPKEERLIFPCTTCQKKFSSKSAVSAHVKSIHFGERPFVCDQCGHSFTSKGILQEHLTIHSDETPFKCQHCFKSFKTKYRLKIHLDIHRETPYQCPVCPLQLSTRRTLRMHLVVHKDTKAFQCSTCGKAFRRAKDLKNHHNLHTGRRPYTCTFCPRTFANGSNCRSHKRRMHPDELRAYEAALLANDPIAAAAAAAGPAQVQQLPAQLEVPVTADSDREYRGQASFSECNEPSMKIVLGLHSTQSYVSNQAESTLLHSACNRAGQLPDGLSRAGQLPDGLSRAGQLPDGLSRAGQLPDGLSRAGQLPDGLSRAGQLPDELSRAGQLPDGLSRAGQLPDGLSRAGQLPDGLSRAGQLPDGLSRAGQLPEGLSRAGQLPEGHEHLRNGHHYQTMSEVSVCSAGRSGSEASRRMLRLPDGLPDHGTSMTPLNLNMSELHTDRHHMDRQHMSGQNQQGNRRMDDFHMQRTHVTGLNRVQDMTQQQQGFVVRSEMGVPQDADQQNILQGYSSMNHALYQQHPAGIGVPAFPGNPYVQHGMASLVNYQRANRNM